MGLSEERIAFVGGGNMAEALLAGLLEAGVAPERICASDPSASRRDHLAARHGVAVSASNAAAVAGATLVVLAVKPSVVVPACREIAAAVASEALVLSIAAGVPTATIEAELPEGARVVRAMPNTPALVQAGATAVAPGHAAGDADLALAEAVFGAVGLTVRVPESGLDAVTGLSGSGPAYVMLMIEALADGGVKAGLPRDVAQALATQTVLGSAELQRQTGEHPAVLKDRVTSPGGTTIAGLAVLEAAGLRGALLEAVVAAAERSRELGRAGSTPVGQSTDRKEPS
ncbi:MAG: pyrroline-5-carboxylate reductase [Myxococcales bacterium]|nr:pyrroline-5-carboxylate reductase [Myxococcales bacterium]